MIFFVCRLLKEKNILEVLENNIDSESSFMKYEDISLFLTLALIRFFFFFTNALSLFYLLRINCVTFFSLSRD